MTDADYDKAIAANAARAAISYRNGDDISGDYWTEQVQTLSDQREAARARAMAEFDTLSAAPTACAVTTARIVATHYPTSRA